MWPGNEGTWSDCGCTEQHLPYGAVAGLNETHSAAAACTGSWERPAAIVASCLAGQS